MRRVLEKIPGGIRWTATFILTLAGWVIFYYTDLSAVGEHLLAMIGLARGASGLARAAFIDGAALSVLEKYTVYPLVAFVCALPVAPWVKERFRGKRQERRLNIATTVLLTLLMAASVVFLIGQSYNPFIYFRF